MKPHYQGLPVSSVYADARVGDDDVMLCKATNLGGLLSAAFSPLVLNGEAKNTGTLLEIECGMAVVALLMVVVYLPGGGGGGDGGPASPAVSDPLKRVPVREWAQGKSAPLLHPTETPQLLNVCVPEESRAKESERARERERAKKEGRRRRRTGKRI